MTTPSPEQLSGFGLSDEVVAALLACFPDEADTKGSATWMALRKILTPEHPFELHQLLFAAAYARRDPALGPPPAWSPSPAEVAATNLGPALVEQTYSALHASSVSEPRAWWSSLLDELGIHFRTPPTGILDPAEGGASARWLPGARLNIAESCFEGRDPQGIALIWAGDERELQTMTVAELRRRSNEVAWGLQATGLLPGDAVAACLPMTPESVAAYLGVVLAGGVLVSISDSFDSAEIARRLRITGARAILTQDVIRRGGQELPLYERVVEAEAPRAIVLPAGERVTLELREGDLSWNDFLEQGGSEDHFEPCIVPAETATHILFSSGTTGEPKAIPWTHITPIKAAADGWGHHDIRPLDVVAWPSSLEWMTGPWLIYASLLRGAAIALDSGNPTGEDFCRFVQDAGVTMLGVVPSIVRAWRASGVTAGLDWSRIRCFSSTGEASDEEDSLWLMSRVAGYRPVLEYCGGIELGGGYLCGSMVQPQAPGTFSTKALGCDFVIIDDAGRECPTGELALIPPLLGASNRLLNREHDVVYFEGMPEGPAGQQLRRHGDRVELLAGGAYRSQGRTEDTMSLAGGTVSSVELERACNRVPGVIETAAIAVPGPGGGPHLLVIYAVLDGPRTEHSENDLKQAFEGSIQSSLDPLFEVHELRLEDALPRTTSGKVMRRVLRARYVAHRDA